MKLAEPDYSSEVKQTVSSGKGSKDPQDTIYDEYCSAAFLRAVYLEPDIEATRDQHTITHTKTCRMRIR